MGVGLTRGDIYWADLRSLIGSEPGYHRPPTAAMTIHSSPMITGLPPLGEGQVGILLADFLEYGPQVVSFEQTRRAMLKPSTGRSLTLTTGHHGRSVATTGGVHPCSQCRGSAPTCSIER